MVSSAQLCGALTMLIKKIFLWLKEIICLFQIAGCKEIISFILPSNFFESKEFCFKSNK